MLRISKLIQFVLRPIGLALGASIGRIPYPFDEWRLALLDLRSATKIRKRRSRLTVSLAYSSLVEVSFVAKRTAATSGGLSANDNRSMRRFSGPELKDALSSLTGWDVLDGKLHKEYKFADFIHAFGFMATAALAIEKMGHHPEWFNVYNRVTVDLTTHDAQGITSKDTDLAKILDDIAGNPQ